MPRKSNKKSPLVARSSPFSHLPLDLQLLLLTFLPIEDLQQVFHSSSDLFRVTHSHSDASSPQERFFQQVCTLNRLGSNIGRTRGIDSSAASAVFFSAVKDRLSIRSCLRMMSRFDPFMRYRKGMSEAAITQLEQDYNNQMHSVLAREDRSVLQSVAFPDLLKAYWQIAGVRAGDYQIQSAAFSDGLHDGLIPGRDSRPYVWTDPQLIELFVEASEDSECDVTYAMFVSESVCLS